MGYRKKTKRGHPLVYTEKEIIWISACLLPAVKHKTTLMDKSTASPCQISKLKQERELSLLFLLSVHWPSLTWSGKRKFMRAVSWCILTAVMQLMRIFSQRHNWRYFQNYCSKILLCTQFLLLIRSISRVPWDQPRENTTFPEFTL